MSNGQSQKSSGSGQKFLYVLFFLFLVASAGAGYWVTITNSQDQQLLQDVAEVKAEVLRIPSLAASASSGAASIGYGEEANAFDALRVASENATTRLTTLRQEIVAQQAMSAESLDPATTLWQGISQNVSGLVENREAVDMVAEFMETFELDLPDIQDGMVNVVDILISSNAPAPQIMAAQEQLWLIERAGRSANKMLVGGYGFETAADAFRFDVNKFLVTQNALMNGDFALGIDQVQDDDALDYLYNVADLTVTIEESVEPLYESRNSLIFARQASTALINQVPQFISEMDAVANDIRGASATRLVNEQLVLILLALMVFTLILIFISNGRRTAKELAVSEAVKNKNQEAILRLLDEISDLADGDLTIQATVSEDFTGTIADSINFAIEELRDLVVRVMSTATTVTAAAADARSTSLQLAESAEHQAQEIAGASAAINEMAITIDQVSSNSSESAAVAEKSVSIAKRGAEVVRDTIEGMDTIREQIQDTSKRIKRLGESSQEIGDIVSLINEIADQTNILALNAAIQAAMAGEAGRGFAVVADEVQRLAERSASATKEIAKLVKTIQTDTNEAVASMEQTTAEVVKGAELANNAGTALEEIESVSAHLAELIQDISEAAKHQATTSSHISNTMNVIQEITSQTLSGTNATAQSVGNLSKLADDMRDSVAGFKVSDDDLAFAQTQAEDEFQSVPPVAPYVEEAEPEEVSHLEEVAEAEAAEELELKQELEEELEQQAEMEDAAVLDDVVEDVLVEEPVEEFTLDFEENSSDDSMASDLELNLDDVEVSTVDEAEPTESSSKQDDELIGLDDFEAEIEAMLNSNNEDKNKP